MSSSEFSVETRTETLPVERGVVEYRFVWGGFAAVDDEEREVRAGDVLSGYILTGGDALVLRAPDGYVVSSAEPTPDGTDGVARWNGPRDFDDDKPRVVFVSEEDGEDVEDTDNASMDGADDTDDPADTDETGAGIPLYAYAVAVVVILSVAAVVYRLNFAEGRDGTEESAASAEEDDTDEAVSDESEVESEPLSDDERVLGMIEAEGGRMKQKVLVQETGWSEAKVSKLTSRLEDEGEITKIRMGRENILEIRDEDEEEEEDGYRPDL